MATVWLLCFTEPSINKPCLTVLKNQGPIKCTRFFFISVLKSHICFHKHGSSLVQVCLTVPYLRRRGRANVVEWAESAAQLRVDKSCESFWCEVWIAPPVGEKRRRCLRRLFRFDCLSASAVTIPCRETENDSVLTLFLSAPLLLFYTLGGSHLCPV